nr:hypothetical protein [Clostridioides sp.]
MSKYSKHRERFGLGGKTPKEKRIIQLILSFKKYLKETPTCQELQITDVGEGFITDKTKMVLAGITDISNNDTKQLDEKNLVVERDVNVDVGCYVRYDNSDWLIQFEEHKLMPTYRKFTMRRCNQIYVYKYKGVNYNIPISVENLTMYSDGQNDGRYFTFPDAKRHVWYGKNPITETIQIGARIMLTNRTVFKSTHINDFEYPGLIKNLVLQTALIHKDDFDENIAWNKDENSDEMIPEIIYGEDMLYVSSTSEYKIEHSGLVNWVFDERELDNIVKIIGIDNNKCTLKSMGGMQTVGKQFTLIAQDENNMIIDAKTITLRM